ESSDLCSTDLDVQQPPRDRSRNHQSKPRKCGFGLPYKRPRGEIVDEPAAGKNSQSDGDTASLRNICNIGIDEASSKVVHKKKQHHSTQPRHERFPAEPPDLLGLDL